MKTLNLPFKEMTTAEATTFILKFSKFNLVHLLLMIADCSLQYYESVKVTVRLIYEI